MPTPACRRPSGRVEAATLEQVWLSQHCRSDGRAFELRYVNSPTGRVRCFLLCRAPGPTTDSADAHVLRLRDDLAATPRHVRAVPVDDLAELRAVLRPFTPSPTGLAEVRKRIDWAWIGRRDARFPLGMTVAPLVAEAVSWEPVWDALARQSTPTMIGVCLEPYDPPRELLGYLGLLAQEYGMLARPGTPSPVYGRYVVPEPFAIRAAPHYERALRTGATPGYRMRVSLATAGASPPRSLAELLAATVSPRAARPDERAVALPVPHHEAGLAWQDIAELQQRWLAATYQQGVPVELGGWEKILACLAEVPEAVAAFRFPYEVPGRPPLFDTARRASPPPPPSPGPFAGGDPGRPVFPAGGTP